MVPETVEPFVVDADDPYGHYARLREEAPVHRIRDGDGNEAWIVTRYEDVRAAFADPRITTDRRVRQEARRRARPDEERVPATKPESDPFLLLRSGPPEHGPLRRATNAGLTFSPRRIAALRPRAEQIGDGLLGGLDAHREVALHREFAYPLALATMGELLGIPPDEARELPLPPETEQDFGDLEAYVDRLLERKRTHVDPDLVPDRQPDHLSAMIAHRDEHGNAPRFDIARTDNHHLSFGRGIHFCLGVSLTKLDAQVGIGTLLRRFPEVAPVSEPEDAWEIFLAGNPFGLTRDRPTELVVRLQPDETA
jgi:cytochrome P450